MKTLPNNSYNIQKAALHYYFDKDGMEKDIREVFYPALLRALEIDEKELWIQDVEIVQCDPEDIVRSKMSAEQGMDSLTYNEELQRKGAKLDVINQVQATVKFGIRGFTPDKAGYIPIMYLPWVRPDGILEHDQKEYSFIHMLEQTDGMTMSMSKNSTRGINIRTNRNNLKVEPSPSGIQILLGQQQKYDIMSVVGQMLLIEQYDSDMFDEIWEDFADDDIYNKKFDKNFEINWKYGGISNKRRSIDTLREEIVPRLMCSPLETIGLTELPYDTRGIRESLNQILSLDQARDKILAKDVYSKDGEFLAAKGTTVSDRILNRLKEHGIYKIYIKKDVDLTGVILKENIIIPFIPKGTPVNSQIESAFPKETGMYTSVDHYQKDCENDIQRSLFIIPEKTPLSKFESDLIINSEIDKVNVIFGNKERVMFLYTEVISNKQFRGSWIGKSGEDSRKWYYMDCNGEYQENLTYGYTAYDMIAIWSFAEKLAKGQNLINLPNIDEDFRKILVPINVQFHRAFKACVAQGLHQQRKQLKEFWQNKKITYTMPDSELLYKFYPLQVYFWKYLTVSSKCVKSIPLSAYNNPIAYISEITKANVYTANKHSIADDQRQIAIGSYGKLDAYEIPQSGRMGVVNNVTTMCDIGDKGEITTPYYRVFKNADGTMRVDVSRYTQMTIEEEEQYVIADIVSIKMNSDGLITDDLDRYILCRVPVFNSKNRQSFEKRKIREVQFVNVNAIQSLSWSAATVPFICNNDAARAVFAVAQMKQAKGLVYPEVPYVMTSAYQIIPRLNDKFGYVANNKEWLYTNKKNANTFKWMIMTADRAYNNGQYGVSDVKPKTIEQVSYYRYRSGDNSTIVTSPNCYENATLNNLDYPIEEGQVVMKSNFISEDGFLQFGRNALVLFIPDGYNYEDSVHVSETFSRQMLSYRINKEKLSIKPEPGILSNMPRLASGTTADSPATQLYSNQPFDPESYRNKVIVRHTNSTGHPVDEVKTLRKAYGRYLAHSPHRDAKFGSPWDSVQIELLSEDKLQIGDKVSNRHGNKGTISNISPDSEMPTLNNGRTADAVQNPLGVGSRMNIGQVKECLISIPCAVIGFRLNADAYNTITDEEIKLLVKFAWDVCNNSTYYKDAGLPGWEDGCGDYVQRDIDIQTGKWVETSVKPAPGVTYPRDLDNILNKSEYATIPADLKDLVRRNIVHIQKWRNTFDQDGLFEYYYIDKKDNEITSDGKSGIKYCKGKAFGGFLYMFKLTQESYEKIHARANDMSDEEYSKISDAATKGAARGGGQRMGTMEIDALCAYGASGYIKELMNERGDNGIARENFNCETYFDRNVVKQYINEFKGQRRSVTQLLYMLLSLGIYMECDSGEFLPLAKDNGGTLSHVHGDYLKRKVGVTYADSSSIIENSDVVTITSNTEQRVSYEDTETAEKADAVLPTVGEPSMLEAVNMLRGIKTNPKYDFKKV